MEAVTLDSMAEERAKSTSSAPWICLEASRVSRVAEVDRLTECFSLVGWAGITLGTGSDTLRQEASKSLNDNVALACGGESQMSTTALTTHE